MTTRRIDHFPDRPVPTAGPEIDRDTPAFSLEQVEYLERVFRAPPLDDTRVAFSMDSLVGIGTSCAYAAGQNKVIAHIRNLALNPQRNISRDQS